jgi:hypothetical protein
MKERLSPQSPQRPSARGRFILGRISNKFCLGISFYVNNIDTPLVLRAHTKLRIPFHHSIITLRSMKIKMRRIEREVERAKVNGRGEAHD